MSRDAQPAGTGGASDLTVALGPLKLAHPLINGSGTLDLFEVAGALGRGLLEHPPVAAYVPKTVTRFPRRGNEPPRILESEGGMLNAIGLPNEGVDAFVEHELTRLLALPCPLILNVGGFSVEDYVAVAEVLRGELDGRSGGGERRSAGWLERVGLELNVSCPNVRSGCMSIGTSPEETRATVSGVRAVWPGLLVVKLTPNVTDIVPVAQAAEAAGADALSLVNTFKGLALDRSSLRPYLGNVTGGLSGPAIKPLALRCVYEVASAVSVPLIGMGGVCAVQDVLDFIACGASVVAVGAAGFRDPLLPGRLAEELRVELVRRRMGLSALRGHAHRLLSMSSEV
jgi:dihydroorotate dehydrogenase (NAD+) catalytic subunit